MESDKFLKAIESRSNSLISEFMQTKESTENFKKVLKNYSTAESILRQLVDFNRAENQKE